MKVEWKETGVDDIRHSNYENNYLGCNETSSWQWFACR